MLVVLRQQHHRPRKVALAAAELEGLAISRQPASGAQISWAQPPAATCSLACDPPPPAAPASSCTSCARNTRQSVSVPSAARVQARGLPPRARALVAAPSSGGGGRHGTASPCHSGPARCRIRTPGVRQCPRPPPSASARIRALAASSRRRRVSAAGSQGGRWSQRVREQTLHFLNPVEQTGGGTNRGVQPRFPPNVLMFPFPMVPFTKTGPPKGAALTPRHALRAVWSCP